MKIIRYIILAFYLIIIVPICVIMIGALAYGGIVETIKVMKKT